MNRFSYLVEKVIESGNDWVVISNDDQLITYYHSFGYANNALPLTFKKAEFSLEKVKLDNYDTENLSSVLITAKNGNFVVLKRKAYDKLLLLQKMWELVTLPSNNNVTKFALYDLTVKYMKGTHSLDHNMIHPYVEGMMFGNKRSELKFFIKRDIGNEVKDDIIDFISSSNKIYDKSEKEMVDRYEKLYGGKVEIPNSYEDLIVITSKSNSIKMVLSKLKSKNGPKITSVTILGDMAKTIRKINNL